MLRTLGVEILIMVRVGQKCSDAGENDGDGDGGNGLGDAGSVDHKGGSETGRS